MKSAKYIYGGIFSLMITCFYVAFRALAAVTGHEPETSGLGILFEGLIVFGAMTWLFGSIIGAVEDGLKEINTPRNPNCSCGCSANCFANGMTSCTTCRADCTCSCKNAGAKLPDASASRTDASATRPDASAQNGADTSSSAGTRDAATPAVTPGQPATPTSAPAGSRCGGKCGGNCKCKDRAKNKGGAGSGSCPSE